MIREEKTLEKLLMIEKAINEMSTLRQGILELKESEEERQKSLEALRASEKGYKTLLDHFPQKMFMKDKNSVYVLCNRSYAEGLKIKPEEIWGKNDYEFFPRELAEKYASDEKRIISTGRSETIQENYVHDGQTFCVQMIRTPVKGETGDITGILGIFEDITEREREKETHRIQMEELMSKHAAELLMVKEQLQQEITERQHMKEQLIKGDERHRILLENAQEAILVIQEGRLKNFNDKIRKITGYREDDLTSQPFKEFIHPDDQNIFQLHLQKVENQEPSEARCFKFIHRDGHILFWETKSTLIQWEGKAAVLNFMMDLTDRKQAEEELWNSIKPFRELVKAVEKSFLTCKEKA